MKKSGILHSRLIGNIAALGHFDSFVICDMGFPIPKDGEIVDLALVRGVLNVRQVLAAVLEETVVQAAVLVEAIREANPELDAHVHKTLHRQQITYCTFEEFRNQAADARFYIRTAEDAPCANILLVSASGVAQRVEQFTV